MYKKPSKAPIPWTNFSRCLLILFLRYVIVYFSVLYLRYRAGIVTDEMLSMPKAPFLAVGLLEALGAATGMAAGGNVFNIT